MGPNLFLPSDSTTQQHHFHSSTQIKVKTSIKSFSSSREKALPNQLPKIFYSGEKKKKLLAAARPEPQQRIRSLIPGIDPARIPNRLNTFSTSPIAFSPSLLAAPHPTPTPLTDLLAIRPRRPKRRRWPGETRRIGWVSWRISSLSSKGTRGPRGRRGAAAAAERAHLRLAFGCRVSEGWRRRAGGWGRFARKEEEEELMSTP